MKLLKKFLLIGLCSFCFYVSANAAININTRDTWDVIDNYLEYNPGKTVDDFIELIINTIPKPEFYADNYIMFIEYNDSSSFYLGWLSSVEFNLALNNTVMYIRDGNIKDSRKSNYSWAFEFNEDYSSLEYNQNSLSTHPAYFNFYSISDGSNPINAFIISSNLTEIKYTAPTWTKSDFTINNGLNYSYDTYIPLNSLNTNYAFVVQDFYNKSEIIYEEPTYSYLVEPSKNGKYKVNFKFENYDDENTNYRFSIVNKISNESFGEENSYKNVCFYDIEDLYNTIPFGNEYSIEVDNSTFLELKLYQYNQIDECYEEIEVKNEFIDVNMINNSYFETEPNFVVDKIEYNTVKGHFENLGSLDNSLNACYYSFSNNLDERYEFDCQKDVDIKFEHNGYISVSLARGNMVLYNRKINVNGGSIDKPKILYDIENNVGYSNIVWSINNQNYSDNISYRYSLNNAISYIDWSSITDTDFKGTIKVTQSNNIILEIKDNETNEIFDSVIIPINVGYSSTIIDNVDLDNYQNLIGYLPPGPVDSILNLPLAFLKSLSKSLSGVCKPITLTLPFVDTDFELPCQSDFYEKIGATSFFNYAGVIASTIIFYSYLIYLYKWVDKIMHLERIEVTDWGSKL